MRKCVQMRQANSDTTMRPKRHVSDTKKRSLAMAAAASIPRQRASLSKLSQIQRGEKFEYFQLQNTSLQLRSVSPPSYEKTVILEATSCLMPSDPSLSPAAVQVRLRLPRRRQRARPRVVLHPAHQQLLRRELGDDLAPVRCHHQLLLNAGRRPAIRRRQKVSKAKVIPSSMVSGASSDTYRLKDGLLPDGKPHPVPVLQRKRRLLAGEPKLLGPGPGGSHIRRRHPRLDHIYGLVQYLPRLLVRIPLRRRRAPDGQSR